MNTWQLLRQIQYLVKSQDWTGSSNTVFADRSVIITSAAKEEVLEKLILPAVLIRPGGNTFDRDAPDLLDQEVVVTLCIGHAGDAYGEFPIVGGHRPSQTRSKGRGMLEVEEELLNAIDHLNDDDGVVIVLRASSATMPDFVAGQYLLFRDYLFRMQATSDRYYHPVINFQEA